MTDAILPESTNSPAASLTSEPEKLLPGQHWQHVKRGTTYEIIGVAELQAAQPQAEHAALAIYRGEDGKLWARNTGEFSDGRFRLSSPVSGTDMVKPDPACHESGWSARKIDGRWCVGMTGNLDTVHDAVVIVNQHASDDAEAQRIAHWIAAQYTSASPSTPIPVIAEAGERERARQLWAKHLRTAPQGNGVAQTMLDNPSAQDERAIAAITEALSTPATLDNTAVEGLEDEIAEALDDSMDMDWTGKVGARHVMGLLRAKGLISSSDGAGS